jgi:23S rRNA (cytosine1962-C5)-methyltransferase
MTPSTYALLDFGDGQRLEQWGEYRLIRPDPTAKGVPADPTAWGEVDAMYEGEKGEGKWVRYTEMPEQWQVEFGDVRLSLRLTPYKHTGVFPEQDANWKWMRARAKEAGRNLNVLHLFAYTGGATVALARDGHFVTHVDASKPSITWAKENAALNTIAADGIRWIVEDAALFVARELKRGKRYDALILDPPAYGHSPSGKTWRVERDLAPLLEDCAALLSDDAIFLLLNGYAQHDTPESFHRLLTGILRGKHPEKNEKIDSKELLLSAKDGRTLSTGTVARCSFRA